MGRTTDDGNTPEAEERDQLAYPAPGGVRGML